MVDRATDVAVLSDLLRKVRIALVMEGETIVGVVTRIDLIDHIARRNATPGALGAATSP